MGASILTVEDIVQQHNGIGKFLDNAATIYSAKKLDHGSKNHAEAAARKRGKERNSEILQAFHKRFAAAVLFERLGDFKSSAYSFERAGKFADNLKLNYEGLVVYLKAADIYRKADIAEADKNTYIAFSLLKAAACNSWVACENQYKLEDYIPGNNNLITFFDCLLIYAKIKLFNDRTKECIEKSLMEAEKQDLRRSNHIYENLLGIVDTRTHLMMEFLEPRKD